MIYMKTSYIAHLPLVVLHTAFIRPPCFLVLQKNNNQNANMNIYYIISSSHFIIFPSNLLPAFIRPPCFLFLQKNNKNKNQNANMNIYYKISLTNTFYIFSISIENKWMTLHRVIKTKNMCIWCVLNAGATVEKL